MEAPKWESINFDKPVKERGGASRELVKAGATRTFRRRKRLRRAEIFQKGMKSIRHLSPLAASAHKSFAQETVADLP